MRPVFIIISITTLFISCFRDTYHVLQKSEIDQRHRFEIKSLAGCCGCKSLFYDVYIDDRLSEQFVVEINCGLYEPTKHFFSLDEKGRVIKAVSLVAVSDSSFIFPVTEIDKKALIILDSIYKDWNAVNKRQMKFSKITGFKEGENTHGTLMTGKNAPEHNTFID